MRMSFVGPLDFLPLWLIFVATVLTVLLAVEAGFQLGTYRRRRSDQEKEAPVGAMVGATLGLLAFLLAFTFGLAASRFDARRLVVLDEANAIGTTYLRTSFLPEPGRAEIRKLLREYVDIRLEGVQSGKPESAITRSSEIHTALWQNAATTAEKASNAELAALFIDSLNSVIDLHSKRVLVALRSRVPIIIWAALYGVTVLAFAGIGYHVGLSGSRRSIAVLALAIAFSGVIFLIAALDRPQDSLIGVSQIVMEELRSSMVDPL
jgi:hypothetical protein